MTFEEYKEKVIAGVELELQNESWFKSVCVNTIKDSFTSEASVSDAITAAISITTFWDGPDTRFWLDTSAF
jgi:hypothetical protein